MAIIRLDNYNICFYPHRIQVYENHTELLCRTRENSGADVRATSCTRTSVEINNTAVQSKIIIVYINLTCVCRI
jgi:hypothetical protein